MDNLHFHIRHHLIEEKEEGNLKFLAPLLLALTINNLLQNLLQGENTILATATSTHSWAPLLRPPPPNHVLLPDLSFALLLLHLTTATITIINHPARTHFTLLHKLLHLFLHPTFKNKTGQHHDGQTATITKAINQTTINLNHPTHNKRQIMEKKMAKDSCYFHRMTKALLLNPFPTLSALTLPAPLTIQIITPRTYTIPITVQITMEVILVYLTSQIPLNLFFWLCHVFWFNCKVVFVCHFYLFSLNLKFHFYLSTRPKKKTASLSQFYIIEK